MENELIKNGFERESKNSISFCKKSTSNINVQMIVILMEVGACVQFRSVEGAYSPIDKWSTGFTIEQINEIYNKFNDLVS